MICIGSEREAKQTCHYKFKASVSRRIQYSIFQLVASHVIFKTPHAENNKNRVGK